MMPIDLLISTPTHAVEGRSVAAADQGQGTYYLLLDHCQRMVIGRSLGFLPPPPPAARSLPPGFACTYCVHGPVLLGVSCWAAGTAACRPVLVLLTAACRLTLLLPGGRLLNEATSLACDGRRSGVATS